MTDPVCQARASWIRSYIVKDLHPHAYRVTNLFRQTLLLSKAAVCALGSPLSLLAMGARYAVSRFQKVPYVYRKGDAREKTIQDRKFTLLSMNICYIPGGFEISDGGVISSPKRIQKISEKILEKNADVVCLYEVFDIHTALDLIEKMKKEYAHFYFSMGTRVVGPPSGIFAATKFAVDNPTFTPFPQEALDGRAKKSGKGIFSFDIDKSARVFATHMGHSEVPAKPTPGEVKARQAQMDIMMQLVKKIGPEGRVVVGDLNLDDDEFKRADWSKSFVKGDTYTTEKTWDGDEYCAKLMQKEVSGPLNLDHSMIVKGTAESIVTELVPTGYDAKVISKKALSDHKGLMSIITLLPRNHKTGDAL
jgi:endonuclease/exonuclease/phosphatase family metal-dependent hydrolase